MTDQLELFKVRGKKESCKNCRWFVEIIGLGRPHPLRCRFAHAHRQLDHLQELPDEFWCLRYEVER